MGTSIVSDMVFEEIERAVADAIATQCILQASTAVQRAPSGPGDRFAAKAGVPVALGRRPGVSGVTP
jgi:hypothetical protein